MVLEERGVNSGMLEADMVKALSEMHDFKLKKIRVEEFASRHGHRCQCLLKYCCELNPVGGFWGTG